MEVIYVIHIATTPKMLWDALTSPQALKKNWGNIESDWTPASKVVEVDDSGKVLWKGEVLRSEPPHVLSYTFDVIGSGEPSTEVKFEFSQPVSHVAAGESIVRLAVTQGGFPDGSKLFDGCARAWPEIMSSFKTYLETGSPLRFAWKH